MDNDNQMLLTLLVNNHKLRNGLYYLNFKIMSVFFNLQKWCMVPHIKLDRR